jgi:hypothetical protein
MDVPGEDMTPYLHEAADFVQQVRLPLLRELPFCSVLLQGQSVASSSRLCHC